MTGDDSGWLGLCALSRCAPVWEGLCRGEKKARALAGARAEAGGRADAKAEAARAAQRRAAMLEATLGRIDAEKARQAAAARTRA